MAGIEKHNAFIEAALEELGEHPDHVIHQVYVVIILHDWPQLAETTDERRQEVESAVSARCLEILCPALGVRILGDEVCFVAQINPDRCLDDVARQAAASVARISPNAAPWTEEYSAFGVGLDDLDEMTAAFDAGGVRLRALMEWLYGDEEED